MKAAPVFLSLVLLSGCVAVPEELGNALAFGAIRDLNDLSPEIEKDVYVRLFESPVHQDGCFIETHGVCQYKYFLSVATFDEYPETNVYELKTLGEIAEINWRKENKLDYAEIGFVFNTYTKEALENNSALQNVPKEVLVKISPTSIAETSTARKLPD